MAELVRQPYPGTLGTGRGQPHVACPVPYIGDGQRGTVSSAPPSPPIEAVAPVEIEGGGRGWPAIVAVLAGLRSMGYHPSLVNVDGKAALAPPPVDSEARHLVDIHHDALLWVALGRVTGHAPATCDHCGFVSLVSIVNSSGTTRGKPSVGWPRCLLCTKGRRIIDAADIEGVRRVRHPSAPRQPSTNKRKGQRRPDSSPLDEPDLPA